MSLLSIWASRLLHRPLLVFCLLASPFIIYQLGSEPDEPDGLLVIDDGHWQAWQALALEKNLQPLQVAQTQLLEEVFLHQAIQRHALTQDVLILDRMIKNAQLLQLDHKPDDAASLVAQAQTLGLLSDDIIIRRRLIQLQQEYILTRLPQREPSTAELTGFAAKQPRQARSYYRFAQYYYPRGSDLKALQQDLQRLNQGQQPSEVHPLALLRAQLNRTSFNEIEKTYGKAFRAQIELQLPLLGEAWFGPIESHIGLHLVNMSALESVEPSVMQQPKALLKLQWQVEQRQHALMLYQQSLLQQYPLQWRLKQAGLEGKGSAIDLLGLLDAG